MFVRCAFVCLSLLFLLPVQAARASSAAWFEIVRPDGTPFADASLYIYDGDIEFDATGNMYPHGEAAKAMQHFLGEVITDDQGRFGIRVQNYTQRSLILVPGSVFYPVRIEKSDGLAHSRSDDHIRIVEWEDGSTRVKANHIHNWKEMTVVTIPLSAEPLPARPAERIALKATYLPKLAPYTRPLDSAEIDALFEPFGKLKYNYTLRHKAHRAMVSGQTTLRAYAATYLGKYGTAESVPYLIDALSDDSAHVGATYADPGMATTRHRARLALNELVGEDFGFAWNAPPAERQAAITKWKDWLNERNIIIDAATAYLKTNDMTQYSVYRAHMNAEKTSWSTALTQDPPMPGAPVLVFDRETRAVSLIKGR